MESQTGRELHQKIRALNPSDINRARKIHEKYYKEEFSLPNFFTNFNCAFAIGEPEPIIYGGVRSIAEVVIVTDKAASTRAKVAALHKMHEASIIIGRNCGYNQLHVFIQDPDYAEMLKRNGFRETKGVCLVQDI